MARPTDRPPADAPGRGDAPAPRTASGQKPPSSGPPSRQNPPPGRGSYPRQPPRAVLAKRPPPEPAIQQRAWAALTLGVLSLVGLYLSMSLSGILRRTVYVIIVTFLIGALAAWLGGSATARARRAGTARPRGAVGGIVLGCLGLVFSATMLIFFAVFWTQLSAYSGCLSGANTLSAQQTCLQQFSQSVTSQIRSMQPGG
jgi:hypothetical protein